MNDNFIQLPRGTFLMGSDAPDATERERPLHEVHIDYDIAMCRYPVTVEEYMLYAQATGIALPEEKYEHLGVDVPLRRVRWTKAKAYCEWKSEREGRVYRLPSEAEWEYACRAGSTSRYCFGDDPALLGAYAWYKENAGGTTHNVGIKKANAWGLYDMHGNVWEWCADTYVSYDKTPVDGSPCRLPSDKGRVLRGGSWSNSADMCTSSSRIHMGAAGRNYFVGFRVVMEL